MLPRASKCRAEVANANLASVLQPLARIVKTPVARSTHGCKPASPFTYQIIHIKVINTTTSYSWLQTDKGERETSSERRGDRESSRRRRRRRVRVRDRHSGARRERRRGRVRRDGRERRVEVQRELRRVAVAA